MSLTGGRRLTLYLRAPTRTAVDYLPTVDANGFVIWISRDDLLAGTGMVPTFITSGETFTIPANKQALYAVTIDNEGIIDVGTNSFLIGVD